MKVGRPRIAVKAPVLLVKPQRSKHHHGTYLRSWYGNLFQAQVYPIYLHGPGKGTSETMLWVSGIQTQQL